MFARFTRVLETAAEGISEVLGATTRSPLQQFKDNWSAITDFIVDHGDESYSVEETDIPMFFDEMMHQLMLEEQEFTDDTGPCMEFLLRHTVLRTCVSLGQGDYPKGIMSEVLRFSRTLLQQIKQPLLPHVSVYGPMTKLMDCCAMRLSKSRNERESLAFATFMQALCEKIADDPSLANFFMEAPENSGNDGAGKRKSPQLTFSLLVHVLNLIGSPFEDVFEIGCNCVAICMTLPSDTIADAIPPLVNETLANRMTMLYAAMPPNVDDTETLTHVVEWSTCWMEGWQGFRLSKLARLPRDSQAFLEFMAWLQFCDSICKDAQPSVSQALSTALRVRCFEPSIGPMLTQESEAVALSTTMYLTACLTQVTSRTLIEAFVQFLLSESSDSTSSGDASRIQSLLLTRCDGMHDELSMATMTLLLRVLSSRSETATVTLVLQHLREATDDPGPSMDRLAQTRVLVDELLGLIPEKLKTGEDDGTYREYFFDAQDRVSECRRVVDTWTGAGKLVASVGVSGKDAMPRFLADSAPATPAAAQEPAVSLAPHEQQRRFVCDAPLVGLLLRRLNRMLSQTPNMNLLVTALLACICQLPHEAIWSALLDPETGALLVAMRKVASDIAARAERIDKAPEFVVAARQAMIKQTHATPYPPSMADLLQSIVVCHDFTKELASIALVKSNELLLV